jgi:hypothetical protein
MFRRAVPSLLLSALFLSTGCTFYADHPIKAFSDATGGEGFERAIWLEIKQQDWKGLESHIASNFVYVTTGGRLERADAIEHMKQLRLQDYTISDLTTEMNRDAFVVTYTITLNGTSQGQPLSAQPQRRMTVWQQQKGGWMAIAHSALGPEQK